MIKGLLATKIGMTQIFQPNGRVVPVTVVQAGPCTVTQIKTGDHDGYEAAQVGFGAAKRLNKPRRGHIGRGTSYRYLREMPVDSVDGLNVGQEFNAGDLFEVGERVDVIGKSKGQGSQDPWSVGSGQGARLHRRDNLPCPRPQGQEDGGAYGQRAGHGEGHRGGPGGC